MFRGDGLLGIERGRNESCQVQEYLTYVTGDNLFARTDASMAISWHWVPGESVGPFHFGDNAEPCIRELRLVKLEPDCSTADWETYEIPGCESRLYVDDGIITDVLCCDSLIYRDSDLLSLTLDELRILLGREDELQKNFGPWDAVYYHGLGLTVCVSDGGVATATCGAPYQTGGCPPEDRDKGAGNL
jgi:hypothetical protein